MRWAQRFPKARVSACLLHLRWEKHLGFSWACEVQGWTRCDPEGVPQADQIGPPLLVPCRYVGSEKRVKGS